MEDLKMKKTATLRPKSKPALRAAKHSNVSPEHRGEMAHKPIPQANLVIREVRDNCGFSLGTMYEPYDGTEEGAIAIARHFAPDHMLERFPSASNIESKIGATDGHGRLKWAISSNFEHIAEISTDEALNVWGYVLPSATALPVGTNAAVPHQLNR
jgi:hypothetical protein